MDYLVEVLALPSRLAEAGVAALAGDGEGGSTGMASVRSERTSSA